MAGPQFPDAARGGGASVPVGSDVARDGADPEALLRQALRAQAGGPKPSAPTPGGGGADDESSVTSFSRLTTAQTLLIAAIIGVILGMVAAFVVLALS